MKNVTNKSNFNFATQLQQFKKLKESLPRYIGNEAVNFYKQSFRRGGFIDTAGVEKWNARKGSDKKKSRRATLVQSGRLRRSIRIVSIGFGYVVVGTDVPYARIHNEGGKITTTARVRTHQRNVVRKRKVYGQATVRSHTRKMNTTIPQRQFMGQSAFLNRRLILNINYKLKKILDIRQ